MKIINRKKFSVFLAAAFFSSLLFCVSEGSVYCNYSQPNTNWFSMA